MADLGKGIRTDGVRDERDRRGERSGHDVVNNSVTTQS